MKIIRGAAPRLLSKPIWQEWRPLPNGNLVRMSDRKKLYCRIVPINLFNRPRWTWMVITGMETPGNASGLGSVDSELEAKRAAEAFCKQSQLA
jgi:hypothetical protein